MTIVGVIGQIEAQSVHKDASTRLRQSDELITLVTQWRAVSPRNAEMTLASILSPDEATAALFGARLKDGIFDSSSLGKRVSERAVSERDKSASKAMLDRRQAVLANVKRARELRNQGDMDAVRRFVEQEFMPVLAAYDQAQGDMLKLQEVQRDEASAEAESQLQAMAWAGAAATGAVLFLALVGTAILLRSIVGPLRHTVAIEEAIATGDLQQHFHSDRKDEIGRLVHAMGGMSDQLRKLVGEVRQGVEMVDLASSEMSLRRRLGFGG